MRRIFFLFLVCVLVTGRIELLSQEMPHPQLGWTGQEIIPEGEFSQPGNWVINAQSGNSITPVPNDSCLTFNYFIDEGSHRWAQAYYVFNPPVSLTDINVFALDIHGSPCAGNGPCHRNVSLEFKFENGPRQAVYVRRGEEGLLSVDRWIERLFFLKGSEGFYVPAGFNWDSVTVFSIAVVSYPGDQVISSDSGYVSFRDFVGGHTASWERNQIPEILEIAEDTLAGIASDAAGFILGRQAETGLLTTWEEDHSSWLYGQGLALKVLVLEGEWENNQPVNDYALAAQKLARFLAANQYQDGSWPRAWNSMTGTVLFPYEADGTIWMGDFPFILMGLEAYLKKACDPEIIAARNRARDFLVSLIGADGKFYTVNKITGGTEEVTSTEAYVAAIVALLETGDEDRANTMISYLESRTWNPDFRYWDEGFYSDRVVLFANTWMANLLYDRGYSQKSMDALSLVGRLLFTRGPGEPYGMDGIGPIAVWYEGTLSYINAGGPGSNFLFRNIIPHINPDGSVPHYNDDIGASASIWAEEWASLDGTSWLYYTASRGSPFNPVARDTTCQPVSAAGPELVLPGVRLFPNPAGSQLNFQLPFEWKETVTITIRNVSGTTIRTTRLPEPVSSLSQELRDWDPGIYFVEIVSGKYRYKGKFVKN